MTMPYRRKKKSDATNNRRGPLSKDEKNTIIRSLQDKTVKEIAVMLRRKPEQIEDFKKVYLAGAPDITVSRTEAEEYRRELHNHSSWTSLQKQFTKEELLFFENDYLDYRNQFKDVTATETKQLHQMITLDIFMQRHNIERIQNQEEIARIEKTLKRESSRDIVMMTREDLEHLNLLDQQLNGLRSSTNNRTKEYKDLLDKHQNLLKDLKGTRADRLRNIEDEGKFMAVLKRLEISECRSNIAEVIGLMDLAVEKEKKRLAMPHKYLDGKIDQPLLSSETVMYYDQHEEINIAEDTQGDVKNEEAESN